MEKGKAILDLAATLPEPLRKSRAVAVLERSLTAGRLGHGILLHGDDPVLLESIARAITAHLLETNGDPLAHPDCFTLRPTGKARNIRIGTDAERTGGDWPQNSMRRLIADLRKTAAVGARKVGILFEADRLNRQASNAFLKTLEEPPPGTTLFLLTTRPYELLDTIRSRCLNFRLPAAMEAPRDPTWAGWREDYIDWLGQLTAGLKTHGQVADAFLRACGLNLRLQTLVASLATAAWADEKKTLPEGIADDERAAIEAGIRRSFRKRLYGEIERATADFAREREARDPYSLPVVQAARALASLEDASGLLQLNFNEASALELFFLKSLRIWIKPGRRA